MIGIVELERMGDRLPPGEEAGDTGFAGSYVGVPGRFAGVSKFRSAMNF